MLSLIVIVAKEKTKNPLIPATNELVWGTIAFLLLLVVLWRAGVFKRISDALAERTARIEGNIEKAEQTRADAERVLAEYRRRLDEAHEESSRLLQEARETAEQLRRELQAKAQEEANRIIESARLEIHAERDRARRELRQEVGILAVRVAERVVRSELDGERQLSLVDSYIEELAGTAGDGGSGDAGPGGAGP